MLMSINVNDQHGYLNASHRWARKNIITCWLWCFL